MTSAASTVEEVTAVPIESSTLPATASISVRDEFVPPPAGEGAEHERGEAAERREQRDLQVADHQVGEREQSGYDDRRAHGPQRRRPRRHRQPVSWRDAREPAQSSCRRSRGEESTGRATLSVL